MKQPDRICGNSLMPVNSKSTREKGYRPDRLKRPSKEDPERETRAVVQQHRHKSHASKPRPRVRSSPSRPICVNASASTLDEKKASASERDRAFLPPGRDCVLPKPTKERNADRHTEDQDIEWQVLERAGDGERERERERERRLVILSLEECGKAEIGNNAKSPPPPAMVVRREGGREGTPHHSPGERKKKDRESNRQRTVHTGQERREMA